MRPRPAALADLQQERFDVVVMGGGITGAGVALDAASRGYSVALVERDDYACGTSSRSSKMVHGGLRYLQNFDLGLVREALLERRLMVELAPHLVHPLPFLVPSFEGDRPGRLTGLGLNMYDVMATTRGRGEDDGEYSWSPERHRIIEGEEVRELLPALAPREPTAAYLFYDCQTDDARLVLSVLGEALRYGAICVNGARAVELIEDGGRAAGVVCEDAESGERFAVAAGNVVNATGVWADRVRPDELLSEEEIPKIRPSRGTHLLLARKALPLNAAVIVPAGEGRGIFALPWLGSTLVGTTDNDYDGELEHIQPALDDVDYLLEAVNGFFGLELAYADLNGAYAGVRPLISTGDPKKSVDISRRAELYETSSGLLTITGGKLTTWRRMAKLVVDRLSERDGSDAECRTDEIPIGRPVELSELPKMKGLRREQREHLARRYGHAALEVLELCERNPDLLEPICAGYPDLLAEAAFAARHEQARRVEDVLLRRTRLGLQAARELCAPDSKAPLRVARAMGQELGWDRRRVKREAEAWASAAAAEGLVVSGELTAAP